MVDVVGDTLDGVINPSDGSVDEVVAGVVLLKTSGSVVGSVLSGGRTTGVVPV